MTTTPHHQHTVSRVLIRQFCGADHKVMQYDLLTGATRRVGPRGVHYVPGFVQHNTLAIELLWKRVEDRVPSALAALRGGGPLGQPETDILKQCLALHWARSRGIASAARRIYDQVLSEHVRTWATRPDWLDVIFHQRYGLVPAGPQARLLALDLLAEGSPEINDGRYFATRLPQFYQHAVDKFQLHHIQVVVAPAEAEFCLGDNPVITTRLDRPGWGPHQGVPLGDAEMVAMPLTPTFAIAMHSRQHERIEATAELVENFNTCQFASAERRVTYRPDSPMAESLARWLKGQAAA